MDFVFRCALRLVSILLFLITGQLLYGTVAQVPIVRAIDVPRLGRSLHIYSAIQADNGVMYFVNNENIIEYNGKDWNFIDVPGAPLMSKGEDGRIYIAGKNTFGYLGGGVANKSVFVPFNCQMDTLGNINGLVSGKDFLLFTANNSLYEYKDSLVRLIVSDSRKVKLFKLEHNIYVFIKDKGFFAYSYGKIHRLPSSTFVCQHLEEIVAYNKYLLLKIKEKQELSLYNFNNEIPFVTEADKYVHKYGYSSMIGFNKNFLCIGTKKGGLLFLNKSGDILFTLTTKNGLYSDQVTGLFSDAFGHLWVLHRNGLSVFSYPSSVLEVDNVFVSQRPFNDLFDFKDKLYINSFLGLHCFQKGEEKHLVGEGEGFKLFENGTSLYSIHADGVYEVDGENNTKKIFSYSLNGGYQSLKDSNCVFLLSAENLILYNLSLGRVERTIKTGKEEVTQLADNIQGDLWVLKNNELYFVPSEYIYDEVNQFALEDFKIEKDILQEFVMFPTRKYGVLFSTPEQVLMYSRHVKLFERFSYCKKGLAMSPIKEDQSGCLWAMETDKNKKTKRLILIDEGEARDISEPFGQQIRSVSIEIMKMGKRGKLWVSDRKRVFLIDTAIAHPNILSKPSVFISKVLLDGDSVAFYGNLGQESQETLKLSYKNKSIKFEFVATDYCSNNEEIFYRYRLVGAEKAWSDWKRDTYIEFSNILSGDYTFQVEAKRNKKSLGMVGLAFEVTTPVFLRPFAYILYFIVIVLAVLTLIFWRALNHAEEKFQLESIINERTEQLLKEKEKSDGLLEKVLPKNMADQLKQKGHVESQKYQIVTVLFSDIQGFTKITEQMNQETLLEELDKFFSHFDTVVEKYNIEKIKTIGDAYMCAGGIPEKNSTNPVEVVLAGMDMLNYVKKINAQKQFDDHKIWGLRIGIDTGPVIAGVVGDKKLAYDIWGGTVNVASRMESSGEIGEINISANTYILVKEYFICTYRGKMPVKNKGSIDMYFVKSIKPNLSVGGLGVEPNEQFFLNLQSLRLNDIEEMVLDKLEQGLERRYTYHNLNHTLSVYAISELLGREESLSQEEILLLRTAALFHDTGYLIAYENHENISVKLAKEILLNYGFSNYQIGVIEKLIMATRQPYNPQSKIEKIIIDADNDHLGREDYLVLLNMLYEEEASFMEVPNKKFWYHKKKEELEEHEFYTMAAKSFRRVEKAVQIEKIEEIIHSF